MGHAFLSPSDAPAWTRCPAKPWMEKDLPNSVSPYASEGTAAHLLREICLVGGKNAVDYVGQKMGEHEVTEEMAEHVQSSVDLVRSLPGEVHCEQRLSIGSITGEKHAHGTADAVILDYDTGRLTINDLKYGRGVPVDVVENEQLMIYAGAAAEEFSLVMNVKEVCMQISQPRNGGETEYVLPIEELRKRLADISEKAKVILSASQDNPPTAVPGDKQCRFCKARATCPALRNEVLETVSFAPTTIDDFNTVEMPADNEMLAKCLAKVGLIENWCTWIRQAAEAELTHGNAVPGYKLVEGKLGNRRWSDESEVDALFKSIRLSKDLAYENKLISPTTAEKLMKSGAIKPRQWDRIEKLITRSAGKPTVVPESDKRPAIGSMKDEFENVA